MIIHTILANFIEFYFGEISESYELQAILNEHLELLGYSKDKIKDIINVICANLNKKVQIEIHDTGNYYMNIIKIKYNNVNYIYDEFDSVDLFKV